MTKEEIRQSDNYKKYFDRANMIHPLVLHYFTIKKVYSSSEVAELAIQDRYEQEMKRHRSIKSCSLNWKSDCRLLCEGFI